MTQSTSPADSELTIKLSNDGRYLQASFSPATQRAPIKLDWLKNKICELGYNQVELNNDALGFCIEQFNAGTKQSVINIGECKDAEFSISISDDYFTVSISYQAYANGKPLKRQNIYKALKESGVRFGVLEDEITKILESSQTAWHEENQQDAESEQTIIAKGIKPVDGTDAYFETMVQGAKDRRPRIDERNQAHYNDICRLVMVKPGDKVARKIPATPGNPGKNVKGEIIAHKPGKDRVSNAELIGARWADDDENVLLAAISGQPVITNTTAMVESTISVDQVDMNTGNIEYDGTITINGDVTTGMSVNCSGDIHIHGMVQEATQIRAGGDIIVSKGVIGRGALFDENGAESKGAARLTAGANIVAKFIENAFVHAGTDVSVEELISHSDVTAAHQVFVGNETTKRGNIMGGVTRATMLVHAKVLGAPAAVQTKIEVGVNHELESQLGEVNQSYNSKIEERKTLEASYTRALRNTKKDKSKSTALIKNIQETAKTIDSELADLKNRQQALTAEIEHLATASITVKQKVYSAVEASLGAYTYKVDTEKNAGTFILEQNKIVFNYE